LLPSGVVVSFTYGLQRSSLDIGEKDIKQKATVGGEIEREEIMRFTNIGKFGKKSMCKIVRRKIINKCRDMCLRNRRKS